MFTFSLIALIAPLLVYQLPLLPQSAPQFSASTPLPALEKVWGISPLKPFLRHRFEGVFQSNVEGRSGVDVRTWYEDASVTRGSKPNSQIFCKMAHSLIFGRSRLRSKGQRLPIAEAFNSSKSTEFVRGTFFAVVLRNRANAANTAVSAPNEAGSRVRWTREEIVAPYLSFTITRSEWETLSKVLRGVRDQSFEAFRDGMCEPILRLAPNLRANFEAVAEANGFVSEANKPTPQDSDENPADR